MGTDRQFASKSRRLAVAMAGAILVLCDFAGQPAQAQYAYPNPYYYPAVPVAPPVVAAPYPYSWGGRRYCWYDSAWNGPGWYWCGYAFRNGFGWGGAYGWNGWARRGGWGGRGGWHGGGGHFHHH